MGGYGNHEHMHYPHALMQNLWLLIFFLFCIKEVPLIISSPEPKAHR